MFHLPQPNLQASGRYHQLQGQTFQCSGESFFIASSLLGIERFCRFKIELPSRFFVKEIEPERFPFSPVHLVQGFITILQSAYPRKCRDGSLGCLSINSCLRRWSGPGRSNLHSQISGNPLPVVKLHSAESSIRSASGREASAGEDNEEEGDELKKKLVSLNISRQGSTITLDEGIIRPSFRVISRVKVFPRFIWLFRLVTKQYFVPAGIPPWRTSL